MNHVARTLATILVFGLFVVGSNSFALAKSAKEIDAGTDEALAKLYAQSVAAKELSAKFRGILVFPTITKGGLVVGGEYGEGALRVNGKTQGYYNSASGSIGLQIGLSSRSLVIMSFSAAGSVSGFINSSTDIFSFSGENISLVSLSGCRVRPHLQSS